MERIYIGKNEATIFFDPEYAARAFFEAWGGLSGLPRWGKARELYADYILEKLGKMRKYIEGPAERIRIERELEEEGNKPKVVVYFKDEEGNELAHINIGWDGESLRADFNGAKEKAERLAAILNALGADVEARKHSKKWRVDLYTDSITAIRRPEWLEAVKSLVEALRERGAIDDERREELLREIEAGPNVVEIAGVELSVKTKTGKSQRMEILYQPKSAEAFDRAVKALKDAGFEEGIHFTAGWSEKGERGHVRLKLPAGLWRLVELERAGVEWAKEALDRLKEMARARGFYDLLNEYLRPAEEAETLDPEKVVAEDPERGIRAVVKDLKLEWEGDRPRVVIEYEAGNRAETFSFIWGVRTRGKIQANVYLNYERAAVLAALTGDESLKGKRGVVTLTAKHLFALARHRGVGWGLLRWYAKAMRE